MSWSSVRFARPALALVLALAAFVLAACGDDDGGGGGQTARAEGPGNGADLAFVTDMIPHHEGAIEMAEVATRRGESEFVKELAGSIETSQAREIATLRSLKAELEAAGITPSALSHEMDMSMDASSLETADPFDQAFVDMMVPHHQDAVLMAREVLEKGENAEVRRLAEAIISAQETEIEEMNDFRSETYGAPAAAGGVPEDGATETHGGGHGGM